MPLPKKKLIVIPKQARSIPESIFPERTVRTISSVTPASLDRVRRDAIKHSDIGFTRTTGQRVYPEHEGVSVKPKQRTREQVLKSRETFDKASLDFMKKQKISPLAFHTMVKLFLDYKIKNKIPDKTYIPPQNIQMFILRTENSGIVNLTADKINNFASWIQGHKLE